MKRDTYKENEFYDDEDEDDDSDEKSNSGFQEGTFVEGEVSRFSPLGINVRLNRYTEGLLHKDQVFKNLKMGDKIKVFIKKIREDGKIDLALQKGGYKHFINDTTTKILAMLDKEGGSLPFNDKSNPKAVEKKFQMSKTKFKDALGDLYRKRIIEITPEGIRKI